jgi:hypothetical protein
LSRVAAWLNAATRDFVLWRDCHPPQLRVSIGAEDMIARDIDFTIAVVELEAMADHIVLYQKALRGKIRH